jgi:hypothetical protein
MDHKAPVERFGHQREVQLRLAAGGWRAVRAQASEPTYQELLARVKRLEAKLEAHSQINTQASFETPPEATVVRQWRKRIARSKKKRKKGKKKGKAKSNPQQRLIVSGGLPSLGKRR